MRPPPRALCLSFLLLHSLPSAAVECQAIDGGVPALSAVDAVSRLHFIQTGLRYAARRTRMWSWSWAATFSAIATAELALLPVFPSDQKVDHLVGAASALVGVGSFVVLPQKVMGDQRWLDAHVAHAAPGTDPCALLATAEGLLLRDAKSERDGQMGLLQASNFLLNIAAGLVLGIGFNHWEAGLLNIFGGSAIGELWILTLPQASSDLLKRYRGGELSLPKPDKVVWTLAPAFSQRELSVQLKLSY